MQPMWTPSAERREQALLTRFMGSIADEAFTDYHPLYDWSIRQPEAFWERVWDFCGVVGEKGSEVLRDGDKMPGARWFPQARLNFAANCLRRRDDAPAIIFRGEDRVRQRLSHAELYQAVASLAAALRSLGIRPGDRVAGVMPNLPQTVIAALACAAVGAIWTSASPDFGVEGLYDRFSQTRPRLLLGVDGYFYNGKRHGVADKLAQLVARIDSIEWLVRVDYAGADEYPPALAAKTLEFAALLARFPAAELEVELLPFDHPLYILYSSGTTGKPKCIVHGAGGTLLQHLKEHQLHCDIRPGDRVLYFTTCGWMMWNWLVSALASGACLLLFDGAPFYPDGNVLFDYAAQERCTFFGTSAKYLDALAKAGLRPAESHDLGALRTLASTGSVLAPESFDYVYSAIKADLNLASISGGTDIVACFMLGCPTEPVYRGQIQVRGLGLAVEVFDADGKAVKGAQGELVCTRPFPSMPLGFWDDTDGSRYRQAYFERFANIWCHGDFVELTAEQGMVVYGRSDATLNPGGVRIGTAEIYRQVDALESVLQSVVVGLNVDSDVQVVLFVQLRDGLELTDALTREIRQRIRSGCTPRHVPAVIAQVADIPRTPSGKLSELAVRDTINGLTVHNRDALANPEALAIYQAWRERYD